MTLSLTQETMLTMPLAQPTPALTTWAGNKRLTLTFDFIAKESRCVAN